jgi:hypothetical protein
LSDAFEEDKPQLTLVLFPPKLEKPNNLSAAVLKGKE